MLPEDEYQCACYQAIVLIKAYYKACLDLGINPRFYSTYSIDKVDVGIFEQQDSDGDFESLPTGFRVRFSCSEYIASFTTKYGVAGLRECLKLILDGIQLHEAIEKLSTELSPVERKRSRWSYNEMEKIQYLREIIILKLYLEVCTDLEVRPSELIDSVPDENGLHEFRANMKTKASVSFNLRNVPDVIICLARNTGVTGLQAVIELVSNRYGVLDAIDVCESVGRDLADIEDIIAHTHAKTKDTRTRF